MSDFFQEPFRKSSEREWYCFSCMFCPYVPNSRIGNRNFQNNRCSHKFLPVFLLQVVHPESSRATVYSECSRCLHSNMKSLRNHKEMFWHVDIFTFFVFVRNVLLQFLIFLLEALSTSPTFVKNIARSIKVFLSQRTLLLYIFGDNPTHFKEIIFTIIFTNA